MYQRRTQRRTKDGASVGYLQLAHNVWDPEAKQSKVGVLYSFGREDRLDRLQQGQVTVEVAGRQEASPQDLARDPSRFVWF